MAKVGEIKVNVIDVGQGQCTFVEIYDDDGMAPELMHTLMFDCGSDKRSDETYTNLDYIVNTCLKKNPPGLDALFFSHSDSDHISLAWDVLSEIIDKCPSGETPEIGRVWYGGNFFLYKKSNFNILNYIINTNLCTVDKIRGFNADSTDYGKITKRFDYNLWHSSDADGREVSVSALAANVISDDPDWAEEEADFTTKTAEEKNRVSLIACLRFKNTIYVICGDATNKTMDKVNGLLVGGTTVFDSNSMTTLPHHGSRATGFAVKSSEIASTTAVNVVKTFAANMKSKTITVSAFQKHSHPSLQLMNEFIPTVAVPYTKDARLKQTNSHRVTARVDIDLTTPTSLNIYEGNDYSFETTTNTYTTFYFDGSETFSYNLSSTLTTVSASQGLVDDEDVINEHACWQYAIASGGSFTINGFADMSKVAFTSLPTLAVARSLITLSEPINTQSFITRTKSNKKIVGPALSNPIFIHQHLKHFT
jgi:hypothetical protein